MFRFKSIKCSLPKQESELVEDYELKQSTPSGVSVSTFVKRNPNEVVYPKADDFTLSAQLASGVPMEEINVNVMMPTESEDASFGEYINNQVEQLNKD